MTGTGPLPGMPSWGQAGQPPVGPTGGEQGVRVLMMALPILFLGMFAWVPPLWAAMKHDHQVQVRRRLQLLAVGCGGAAVLGFGLFSAAPTDADGVATGLLPWFGFVLLVAAMAVGTTVAVQHRDAGVQAARRRAFLGAPNVQRALAGRQVRAQYRDLAERDPALAHVMRVGRPDLPRDFSDGGLVDLNALPADRLVTYAGLRPDQAQDVVQVRQKLRRLTSVDELVVHGSLDIVTAERLREYAVFL